MARACYLFVRAPGDPGNDRLSLGVLRPACDLQPALAAAGLRLAAIAVGAGAARSSRVREKFARRGVTRLPALLCGGQTILGVADIVAFLRRAAAPRDDGGGTEITEDNDEEFLSSYMRHSMDGPPEDEAEGDEMSGGGGRRMMADYQDAMRRRGAVRRPATSSGRGPVVEGAPEEDRRPPPRPARRGAARRPASSGRGDGAASSRPDNLSDDVDLRDTLARLGASVERGADYTPADATMERALADRLG